MKLKILKLICFLFRINAVYKNDKVLFYHNLDNSKSITIKDIELNTTPFIRDIRNITFQFCKIDILGNYILENIQEELEPKNYLDYLFFNITPKGSYEFKKCEISKKNIGK